MTRERLQEITERVLAGDGAAFEEIVLEHQKAVYNLALRMTQNAQDALDVSQDVFMRAFTQLGTFRGESKFSVWLYRMTYNICIDHLRKNGRNAAAPLETVGEDGETVAMEIPDMRSMPEDEAEKRELISAVSKALDELSPDHRQVLVLREQNGLSYEEIADILSISDGTVKSRINRARKNLASILIANGTFSAAPSSYRGKEAE